jgi:hypothetical protein
MTLNCFAVLQSTRTPTIVPRSIQIPHRANGCPDSTQPSSIQSEPILCCVIACRTPLSCLQGGSVGLGVGRKLCSMSAPSFGTKTRAPSAALSAAFFRSSAAHRTARPSLPAPAPAPAASTRDYRQFSRLVFGIKLSTFFSAQSKSMATKQRQNLGQGWWEMEDANGRVYYANKQTKQTSWKKPVLAAAPVEEPKVSKQAATKENVNRAVAPQVQDLWREVVDKKSGKTYYYNRETKETRWTNPATEVQRPESALSSNTVSESLYSESHPRMLCASARIRSTIATCHPPHHVCFPHRFAQVCRESRSAVGSLVLGQLEVAGNNMEHARGLGFIQRRPPRILSHLLQLPNRHLGCHRGRRRRGRYQRPSSCR